MIVLLLLLYSFFNYLFNFWVESNWNRATAKSSAVQYAETAVAEQPVVAAAGAGPDRTAEPCLAGRHPQQQRGLHRHDERAHRRVRGRPACARAFLRRQRRARARARGRAAGGRGGDDRHAEQHPSRAEGPVRAVHGHDRGAAGELHDHGLLHAARSPTRHAQRGRSGSHTVHQYRICFLFEVCLYVW